MKPHNKFARLLVTLFSTCLISLFGLVILALDADGRSVALADTTQQGFATATSTTTPTLTRTPMPTSTPPNSLVVAAGIDLKSSLFFSSGSLTDFEGCPAQIHNQIPDIYTAGYTLHRRLTNGGYDICVQGVTVGDGDLLTLQLFSDSGTLVATQSLRVAKADATEGLVLTNDSTPRLAGTIFQASPITIGATPPVWDMMLIRVNVITNLPDKGHWVLTTPALQIASKDVGLLTAQDKATLLTPTNNLIGYEPCPTIAQGETFALRMFGMPPNQNVPIGIYRGISKPGTTPEPNSQFGISGWELLQAQLLSSDSLGIVNGAIQIPYSAAPGVYVVSSDLGAESCGIEVVVQPPTPVPPVVASSADSDFYEGFGGTALDPTTWRVENTTYYTSVDGGVFDLYGSGARFPFVRSVRRLFPSYSDYSAEINFRYLENNACGVGVMMTSTIPTAGLSAAQSNAEQYANETTGVAIGFWQDPSGMKLWYRAGSERKDIYLGGPDTDWHDLWVEYNNNRYYLYMDNNFYFESQPTYSRLDGIWMGNPQYLGAGANCDWSALEMDYISIKQ